MMMMMSIFWLFLETFYGQPTIFRYGSNLHYNNPLQRDPRNH
jgi:hypothetical protein